LLSIVMKKLRRDRSPVDTCQPYYVRVDRAMEGVFAQLWFLTRGCTWDRAGSCTMCNYGTASAISAEEMVAFVRRGLESIDVPLDELYVSPSGSLLDPVEVPEAARRGIYDLVNRYPVPRFSFETRAETLTPVALAEIARMLPTKTVAVGLGVESVDPWIRRFCVNKVGDEATMGQAAMRLRRHGLEMYANVSLGTAFLSPGEAIADAARSVRWALKVGADLVLVFPLHVKSNTLLAWLFDRDEYRPPSLWSLVEVLQTVDRSLLPKVNISWYRSDYSTDPGVIASPTTCPRCAPTAMRALDTYRAHPCADTLDEIATLRCDCRERWEESTRAHPTTSLPERVLDHYERLASHFDLDEWWTENADQLRREISVQTQDRP